MFPALKSKVRIEVHFRIQKAESRGANPDWKCSTRKLQIEEGAGGMVAGHVNALIVSIQSMLSPHYPIIEAVDMPRPFFFVVLNIPLAELHCLCHLQT